VAIKDLLEVLNQWAVLKATEDKVSDVYVRLGNGLNDAVGAFAAYRIDMSYVNSLDSVVVTRVDIVLWLIQGIDVRSGRTADGIGTVLVRGGLAREP
jgi:hypothetical protein